MPVQFNWNLKIEKQVNPVVISSLSTELHPVLSTQYFNEAENKQISVDVAFSTLYTHLPVLNRELPDREDRQFRDRSWCAHGQLHPFMTTPAYIATLPLLPIVTAKPHIGSGVSVHDGETHA